MSLFYQKYLPNTFDEISGHNKVKEEFKNRIKENNIPQNIFFLGSSGVGKGVFTKIISKIIHCKNKIDPYTPCNQCQSCKNITNERSSIDFYLYNASNVGKEEMRTIDDLSRQFSFSGNPIIINIEEFQDLTKATQDAILLALGRKNPNVHFIMTSMEDKAHESIHNRCMVYRLNKILDVDIAYKLKEISEKEGIDIDNNLEKAQALFSIAGNSNGSLRTAISLLERVIYGNLWSKQDLINELHIIDEDSLLTIMDKILSGDGSFITSTINEKIFNTIKDRLLLIYKAQCGVELNNYTKQLVANRDKVFDKIIVENILRNIHEIYKYYYKNSSMMEFLLLSGLPRKNNEGQVITENSVRRRRKIE